MTTREKKLFLNKHRGLVLRIHDLENELDTVVSQMDICTDVKQLEELHASRDSLIRRINRLNEKRNTTGFVIEKAIDNIGDDVWRAILQQHYLDGVELDDIGDYMGYSHRGVVDQCKWGVRAIMLPYPDTISTTSKRS